VPTTTDQGAAGREAIAERAARDRAADPAKLTKALRTVIAGAPRLTADQVERLRALLPDDQATGDTAG
jgi:hypothetical protein